MENSPSKRFLSKEKSKHLIEPDSPGVPVECEDGAKSMVNAKIHPIEKKEEKKALLMNKFRS